MITNTPTEIAIEVILRKTTIIMAKSSTPKITKKLQEVVGIQ